MSSSHDWICLSHDPGLPLGLTLTLEQAEATKVMEHADCDMVIGRWSGALTQLGCPGGQHASSYHTQTFWMDTELLRVIYAAARAPKDDDMKQALGPVLSKCWSWQRLDRLRALLGEA